MAASAYRPIIAARLSSCQRCGIDPRSKTWDFQEFIRPNSGLVAVGDFISIFESREVYHIDGPLGAYENIAGRVIGINSGSRSHISFSIQYTAQLIITLRVPFHLSRVGRLRHIQHTFYQILDLGRHRVALPENNSPVLPKGDSPAPANVSSSIFPVLNIQDQGTGGSKAPQGSMDAPTSPYSTASTLPLHSGQLDCWRRSGLPGVDTRDYMPFSPRFIHQITSQQVFAPSLPRLHKELIETKTETETDSGTLSARLRAALAEVDSLTETSPGSSLWECRSVDSSSWGGTDVSTSSSEFDGGSRRSGIVFANLVPTNSLDSLFMNIH